MNAIQFECVDYPVVARFQTPLSPSQTQRLRIMSRSQTHRCADVCELVADLADSWDNPVLFTLPRTDASPSQDAE